MEITPYMIKFVDVVPKHLYSTPFKLLMRVATEGGEGQPTTCIGVFTIRYNQNKIFTRFCPYTCPIEVAGEVVKVVTNSVYFL